VVEEVHRRDDGDGDDGVLGHPDLEEEVVVDHRHDGGDGRDARADRCACGVRGGDRVRFPRGDGDEASSLPFRRFLPRTVVLHDACVDDVPSCEDRKQSCATTQ